MIVLSVHDCYNIVCGILLHKLHGEGVYLWFRLDITCMYHLTLYNVTHIISHICVPM